MFIEVSYNPVMQHTFHEVREKNQFVHISSQVKYLYDRV
jgi:hypothetical protein